MIPAAFDYAKASSVDEAVKLLDRFGEDAKVLAGGHSLIPLMRLRLAQPKALVDINGIETEVAATADGGLAAGPVITVARGRPRAPRPAGHQGRWLGGSRPRGRVRRRCPAAP